MVDTTKDWNMDQVILAPGSAVELIQHYRRREQELLEANNRYLERARAAEAIIACSTATISGAEEELEELRTVLEKSEPGIIVVTPPPSTHLRGDEARRKLNLWFFRDLSGEQRGKLFTLFGLSDAQKDTNHGYQAMGLAHVVRLLATTEGKDNG